MSAIGKYTPLYDPISVSEPTAVDLKIDASLKSYMDVEMKLETDEEMERRSKVLLQVEQIFLNWVRSVAVDILKFSEEEARSAGGELFISGSHKLGVREPGADIDTVGVAPNFCTREHFFTLLKEEFINHPAVTEFNAVETALVPLMSFDFEGVSIDFLFARLAENVVPKKFDILDDNVLIGLDDATEKSLNGPRVTMMIAELVGKEAYSNFLIVLRCVRRWAKRRGLYGNKLGYLGGVNCNILVAFVCQLYPKASPSTLLVRFFQVYTKWEWPKPVQLNHIRQNPPNSIGKEHIVWNSEDNPYHLMPIITPAYPAMNSSEKVSKHTLAVMQYEFARAHAIIKAIIAEREKVDYNIDWDRLFESSDFFLRYSHYLALHIVGSGQDTESRGWMGFLESRMLGFTRFLDPLPLKQPIHFFPIMSKTDKSSNSICYFVGFDVDTALASRGDKVVHIDDAAFRFYSYVTDPEKGFKGARKEGMDFFVEHYPWKKLPKSVFDSLGGREIAKKSRAALLSALNEASGGSAVTPAKDSKSTPARPSAPETGISTGIETPVTKIEPAPSGGGTVTTQEDSVNETETQLVADGIASIRKRTRSTEESATTKIKKPLQMLLPPHVQPDLITNQNVVRVASLTWIMLDK